MSLCIFLQILGRTWEMKLLTEFSLFLLCFFIFQHSAGLSIRSLPYDYFATAECLSEPRRAVYGGGMIINPEFDHGMEGWTTSGNATIEERTSMEGNKFLVARDRRQPLDSFSQRVQLQEGMIYSFSAWIQISEGNESVSAILRSNSSESILAGKITAKQGCWTLLKGGIVANASGSADIVFKSSNVKVELWIDNVSLQPFTKSQWRIHQENSIHKVRKSRVRFQVTDSNGAEIGGARVYIEQKRSAFPFGCAMNYHILESTGYQKWFASRFRFTTFTNEMKWYSTEKKPGEENYTIPDAMMRFARENNISVRGHNIFWDNPEQQPDWVKYLSSEELRKAAAKRIHSVVSRYKGELIAWDVMNENLHFSFFEDKLGANASAEYFYQAYQLDPEPTMFMNEYNTIEYSQDEVSGPDNYKKKLQEILSFPGTDRLTPGIGLQGHFTSGQPNLAYMRSGLDILGTVGVPIWLTEVSVDEDPNQAEHLEEVLREAYSHPAVEGIIMFTGPAAGKFAHLQLADENFNNTPAGDVVDKLLKEWNTAPSHVIADRKGFAEISMVYGDYDVTVEHPAANSSNTYSLNLRKEKSKEAFHVVKVQA